MKHWAMKEYDKQILLARGGLWESHGLDLNINYLLFEDARTPNDVPPCPHCKCLETFQFAASAHDLVWSKNAYICPRVVVAYNEGGHATTGVCLDCLIEATGVRHP